MKHLQSKSVAVIFFVFILSLSSNAQSTRRTKIITYKDYERFFWGVTSNNLERWHVRAFSINSGQDAKGNPFVVIYEKDMSRAMNTIRIVSYQDYNQFSAGVRQENAADWSVEAFALDPNPRSGAAYIVVYVKLIKKRSVG